MKKEDCSTEFRKELSLRVVRKRARRMDEEKSVNQEVQRRK